MSHTLRTIRLGSRSQCVPSERRERFAAGRHRESRERETHINRKHRNLHFSTVWTEDQLRPADGGRPRAGPPGSPAPPVLLRPDAPLLVGEKGRGLVINPFTKEWTRAREAIGPPDQGLHDLRTPGSRGRRSPEPPWPSSYTGPTTGRRSPPSATSTPPRTGIGRWPMA